MNSLMNDVIRDIKNANAFVDDVWASTMTIKENLETLRELFIKMNEREMFLNLSKCEFFKTELTFLGYRVSERGVEPMQDKVAALTAFEKPRDVRTLRKFLGMSAFNKRFTPNLAQDTPMLYKLFPTTARRNQKIKWTQEAEIAFEKVKKRLKNYITLTHPIPDAELNCIRVLRNMRLVGI